MHSSPDSSPHRQRQALSALMDGDLPPGDLTAVIAGWQQDDDARASWHAYHLIGDVLRSDDLATRPARDEVFLQALRGRLAREPAPLAVAPLMAIAAQPAADPDRTALPLPGRRRAAGWLMAPAAVAAGFVVVAGIMVVTKVLSPDPAAAPQFALVQPATQAVAQTSAQSSAQSSAKPAPDTLLVRDARLDRYLAAHRNLGNGFTGAAGAERTVQIVYEPK